MKMVASNVQSLKFPIGPDNISKIESNSIEAVKNLVEQKKGKGIKLFREKKNN